MKTAVSLPDALFKSGDILAKRLGVSRSELYARALADFVARYEASQFTQHLNAVRLVDAPGNVLIPAHASGLPRDSVANVTQVLTINRDRLTDRVRGLSPSVVTQVDEGLRVALDL